MVRRLSLLALVLYGPQELEHASPPSCRPLSRDDRTIAGIVVGGMTLEDAARRLGPAKLQRRGHGHEFRQALCYRSAGANDDTVLVFANGNTERNDTVVTSAYLGPASGASVNLGSCVASPRVSRALRFASGPSRGAELGTAARWLGVSRSLIERRCTSAPPDEEDSVAGLPTMCVDAPDEPRPDGTTLVVVGLHCEGDRVTSLAMAWSDFW